MEGAVVRRESERAHAERPCAPPAPAHWGGRVFVEPHASSARHRAASGLMAAVVHSRPQGPAFARGPRSLRLSWPLRIAVRTPAHMEREPHRCTPRHRA